MILFGSWFIKLTKFLMLFRPFWIHLIFAVILFPGENKLYISNHHCLFIYIMQIFNGWLIYWANLLILLIIFYVFLSVIVNQSKVKTCSKRLFSSWLFPYIVFWSILLWIFSFDISLVGCWFACSWLSDQN